jgi:hypothetical protein
VSVEKLDTQNKAYFSIQLDVLRRLLNLPNSWKILGIVPTQAQRFDRSIVDIVVEGPGLPEVEKGQILDEVVLLFEDSESGVQLKAVKGDHYYCEVPNGFA